MTTREGPAALPSILEAHLENAPLAFIEFDPEFRVTRWAGAAERIFGWTREEILGRRIQDLRWVVEEDAEKVARVSADMVARRRTSFLNANRNYRKDGSVIHTEWYNSATYDAGGALVSVFAAVLDVTDRVRAEAALRASEARYRAVVANTRDTITIQDRDLRYELAVNPALGFTPEAMLGRTDFDIMPADEAALRAALKREVLETGAPQPVALQRTGPGGEVHDFEGVYTPRVGPDGRVDGVISYLRDVTDRKRAEAAEARAFQARTVRQLAGGVAHQINNALQAISLNVEMAIDEVRDPEVRASLQEIVASVRRASAFVDQLLAAAGEQRAAPQLVDLRDAVAERVPQLRRQAGAAIAVQYTPSEEACRVRIDPRQLADILAALVENARDAIEGSGHVRLATASVTLDEAACAGLRNVAPGPFVRLCVSDDGPGMPAEVMGRIYEPFFTTSRFGTHAGLGIPMVNGIVRQNRGAMEIASEPGQGTTVRIWLPRAEGEPGAR